jgi:hypothetical protein
MICTGDMEIPGCARWIGGWPWKPSSKALDVGRFVILLDIDGNLRKAANMAVAALCTTVEGTY